MWQVQIPNSRYTIDSRNNKLYFDDGSAKTATISSGQFSGTTLASTLQSSMNAVSSGFTVSYSTTTNKMTISHASNFELTTTSTNNAVWEYIGFDTDADNTASNSYTSDNQVNLTNKYVYMTLSFADNPQLSLTLPDNVALIILNSQAWGSLITGEDNVTIRSNERHFEYFDYKFYDDKGNILSDQGIHASFRITFY